MSSKFNIFTPQSYSGKVLLQEMETKLYQFYSSALWQSIRTVDLTPIRKVLRVAEIHHEKMITKW